jgi:hypothetical protein
MKGTPKGLSVERVHDFTQATDIWFKEFAAQHHCVLNRSAAMYRWIFCHEPQKKNFAVFQVSYNNQVQGYFAFKTKYNAGSGFKYMELIDEAILPVPEKIRKAITLKVYYEVNKIAENESFLLMRSNNENIRSAFRKWLAIPVRKVEKTTYRETFLKPGETPFLTSLDGDSIFF